MYLKGREPNPKSFCVTGGGKDGRHACSWSRFAREDFLPSHFEECSQPLGRQQKGPLDGYIAEES